MKVKNKRILKNGAVAGYVYYESEKKWKWRIIKGPLKGGRKKKKFKGKKVNPLNYIRNTYHEVMQEQVDSDIFNEYNENNEYNEYFDNVNFSRKKRSYKKQNTTYERSKNNKINDVYVYYIKLFGRQFVLLGEIHTYRHSENLINYSNLIKIPLKLSKKHKKCIDVYIEENIYNKPIINNDEYKVLKQNVKNQYNESLTKLIYNLTNREKYQMHKYYRLHSFDTREFSQKKDNNTNMTRIFNLLFEIKKYSYNFNDFLIEIFKEKNKENIRIAVLKLLINYSEYIEKNHFKLNFYRTKENIKNNENISNYIRRKHNINIDYMTNYFFNLVSRIYKEYNKVPNKFKERDISPPKILEQLEHKELFMTDMYLFYRLLMNFNTTKRNTGQCKNYSEISFTIGGAAHIENIFKLLNYYYGNLFEDKKLFVKMSINEYQSLLEEEIFN